MRKQIKRLSQNDSRWNRISLGNSRYTIGGHGCLSTCIAMACGITPTEVVKKLEFTNMGYILWNDKNKKALYDMGLEYIGRYREFRKEDINNIKELCNTENYFPILQVRTRNQGEHWVLPIGRALTWRGLGWATNDPWDGSRQWKTVGFGAPYLWEKGWVLFKKVPNKSS